MQWNHPNMPWDTTELWVADIGADGNLTQQRRVRFCAVQGCDSREWPFWSHDRMLVCARRVSYPCAPTHI